MGEVYRARDTRLDRDVALKVLPEELSGDEERLRRFEREAKTLASLNHPNVAQVFGIDQVGDTCFMAMELVPGEDLAARLSHHSLPLDEALGVCRQIAEGVEAAHEAGVIHRDLKPANVVITPEGMVKVLDFGLAKSSANGGTASSTDSVLTTEEGRLLGTPAYMAPEQARGKPIDRRVDVWAFGCVLFECLTGRRAFDGDTVGDVLASVLEREPDWSVLSTSTPDRVRELMQRCLRKDSRQRLRDVGDARVLLEELGSDALGASIPAEAPRRGARPWGAFLSVTTVAAIFVALWFWRASGDAGPPRLEAVGPITNTPVWNMSASWSPKGENIAYSELTERGLDVFIKPTVGGVPVLRADSPGDDVAPRFSPDGRTLAFVSSSMPGSPVFLVDAQGDGKARPLIETGLPTLDLNSTTYVLGDRPWLPDGRSLLASIVDPNGRVALHRVDIETAACEQLTFPELGENDFGGSLSFDGERVVFSRNSHGGGDLWTMPTGGGEPTVLLDDLSGSIAPAWRPDNRHVVFIRSTRGGYYDAWDIDTKTCDLRQITYETRRVWSLSVAVDDRIAFTSLDHDTFLHSVSRTGDASLTRINAHSGDNFGARPAPGGRRIAYHSSQTGNPEIWLVDLDSGKEEQLTDNPAADLYPDWSPDGNELAFVSNEGGPFQVVVLDVQRGTRRLPVENKPLTVHGAIQLNASILARWSPDPADPRIAFIVSGDGGHTLWTVNPDGSNLREAMTDVYGFDWYVDSRRGLVTRRHEDFSVELLAVNLETGDTRLLATIPHTELEVAPDGTAVSFCSGPGHSGLNVHVLELEPPTDPDGLPTAAGEPVRRTDGQGRWHTHNGGWMPDSHTLVFTRDEDYGNVFELIESR